MRRVVVTGLGVVSPVGVGVESFWRALTSGTSGIELITHFDTTGYSTRFAGMVYDFDPSEILDKKEARRMSRFIQFAIVAAHEAITDSGIEIDDPDGRVGVIFGSGIGGLEIMEEQHSKLEESGPHRVSPFLVPMMITDMAAGQVSMRFGAHGINYCPVSACATGNHAIGEAAEAIRSGRADVVIAGSSDAGVTPLGLAGFSAARALSVRNEDPQTASRPFDATRDGFVMGEGGGAVILEALDDAHARGARIYGEILGYGATADAYHLTAPHPEGLGAATAMRAALKQARLEPSDVDYINAHGTSTPAGDLAETLALKKVFGQRTPAVSSTKSMTGHLLGGAGSIEFIACALAMRDGIIPPTINYTEPDPACDLDYVPNVAREIGLRAVMSNSFGFGGHNATLVVGRVGS